MPILPLRLRLEEGPEIPVHGLLDTGATVNVLPFSVGLRLGAVWERQKTTISLAGNLAGHESRALLTKARIGEFPSVHLAFAWTRSDQVPLILGQVNFFNEFDVSFQTARRQFEVMPAFYEK